jgi:hypothetical protein
LLFLGGDFMGSPLDGESSVTSQPGVTGGSPGDGVFGFSGQGFGVHGVNQAGLDPDGRDGPFQAVQPTKQCGVYGESWAAEGVVGSSGTTNGVHGSNDGGSGVKPNLGCGVFGESGGGYGVYGVSKTASGVYGASGPGHLAGEFAGDVGVTGKLTTSGDVNASGDLIAKGKLTASDVLLSGADCAEQFDAAVLEAAEPGTVLVIDENGAMRPSARPYDRCVAGVVSGAGAYRPAIVMDGASGGGRRTIVALVGKVYCNADAAFGAIEVGDMLTTSPTPGHAMKASDRDLAFGAVIGKALRPLTSGRGLVPILIALQ